MENRRPTPSSAEYSPWTWIMVGILLLLGAGIGVGSLALTSIQQHPQVATGSQTVPSSH